MVRWEQSQMNITDAATARNKKQLGIKTSEYWSWILIQLKHSTNMLRPWIDSKISLIIFNIDYSLVVTPATLIRTKKSWVSKCENGSVRGWCAWETGLSQKRRTKYKYFSAGDNVQKLFCRQKRKKIRKEVFPDQEEQRRPTEHKTEALGKGKKPLHQLQVSDRLNLTHFFSGYFSSLYTSNNVFGKF